MVSVKPNKSIALNSGFTTDHGRLMATNVSLRGLIVRAYGIQDYQVEGPVWLSSERFDVSATFPDGLPKDRDAVFRAMMQNMLAERFKLAAHREQKTRPVYALILGKNGIKFKEAPDSDCGSHGRTSSDIHFTGTCISMDAFAEFLARRAQRRDLPVDLPVLDMTGLKGFYNLTLDWIPESRPSGEGKGNVPVGESSSGVTLMVALEEQLGLKLETRNAPIEILIVDHAERAPSEN